jgi:CubicO group peptidase (beta-lactamase class C family)
MRDRSFDLRRDLETLENFGFSGAVVIAERGQTILSEGYGTECDDGEPVSTRTRFDVGSLAKQFTAAAVLMLETENALTLADSVARFFPGAPSEIGALTIHQLLTHTSGMPRGNLVTEHTTEFDPLPRDSALVRIFSSKLRFPAGSQQAYSNAGYVLLAAIVEQASGESYTSYLREHLWRPARMRDARFWGETAEHAACGKDDLGVITQPDGWPKENWSIRGAGGMLMSADDLHHWFDALMEGRILPAETVRRMMSPQVGGFGYGWRIGPLRGDSTSVFHGGDYHGFGAQLIWQPRNERLVVILANIRHEDDNYPTRIRAEDAALGRLDDTPVSLPVLKRSTRHSISAGVFTSSAGARFRFERVGDALYLGALNQEGTSFLAPVSSPDTAAYMAALTERSVDLIGATLASDSAAVRRTLSEQDDPPYVFEQLILELGELLHGRSATVSGLGTYPASIPSGAFWSVVQLEAEADTTYYMLRWYQDVVASYHLRAPSIAARLHVVPSGDGWLAWDIVRRGHVVGITPLDDRGDRLRLANGVSEVSVSRVAP